MNKKNIKIMFIIISIQFLLCIIVKESFTIKFNNKKDNNSYIESLNKYNVFADAGYITTYNSLMSDLDDIETNKANIDSPVFTGTPTAPTAAAGTKTNQIATTAFVNTAINNAFSYQGTYSAQAPSGVSVPTGGTYTDIASITLTKGRWVLTGNAQFSTNNNGRRRVQLTLNGNNVAIACIAAQSAAVGQPSIVGFTCTVKPSTSTTYILQATQNSGTTLTAYGRIYAMRLSES